MCNLGQCFSAVLASALRNPDSSQHQDFNIALECLGGLVDFSLMTQYRSHTPDTLAYMQRYLQTFHHTKDIFLEFRTSKSTRAEVNRQDRELRILMANQIAQKPIISLLPNAVGRRIKTGLRGLTGGQI